MNRTSMRGGAWQTQPVARWEMDLHDGAGSFRIYLDDLDNNGTVDLVISGTSGTRAWLLDESHAARPMTIPSLDSTFIESVVDVNGDGQLDLVGRADEPSAQYPHVVRFLGKGTKGYHWQVMRPRAQPTAGDQRINSFGIGGEIEVRTGLLDAEADHHRHAGALRPRHAHRHRRRAHRLAERRPAGGVRSSRPTSRSSPSSGSRARARGCSPDDGRGMRFVTDFLWRSPLGLRINAQDTAGVTQTEDWVKIRGDQLVAARRRLRRPHHRRAVGDALLRSRVAAGRRSSGRTPRCSSTSGSRATPPALAVHATEPVRVRSRRPGTIAGAT